MRTSHTFIKEPKVDSEDHFRNLILIFMRTSLVSFGFHSSQQLFRNITFSAGGRDFGLALRERRKEHVA